MEGIPHKPAQPPTRGELTSDVLLQVNWSASNLPENGGAQVLSYHLQYDGSSNGTIWTDLVGIQ